MTVAEVKERISRLKTIYPFEDGDTRIDIARGMSTDRAIGITLTTFNTDMDVDITMTAYARQK